MIYIKYLIISSNRSNFQMRFNTVFWASGGDQYTVSSITPVSNIRIIWLWIRNVLSVCENNECMNENKSICKINSFSIMPILISNNYCIALFIAPRLWRQDRWFHPTRRVRYDPRQPNHRLRSCNRQHRERRWLLDLRMGRRHQ